MFDLERDSSPARRSERVYLQLDSTQISQVSTLALKNIEAKIEKRIDAAIEEEKKRLLGWINFFYSFNEQQAKEKAEANVKANKSSLRNFQEEQDKALAEEWLNSTKSLTAFKCFEVDQHDFDKLRKWAASE